MTSRTQELLRSDVGIGALRPAEYPPSAVRGSAETWNEDDLVAPRSSVARRPEPRDVARPQR